MGEEYEVVSHGTAEYKLFLISLQYRTPHVHKEIEVCLLLEGCLRLLTRDHTVTYEAGSLWVTNPFESHELIAEQPALILSLQIPLSFFTSSFPQIESIEFLLPTPLDAASTGSNELAEPFLEIARTYFSQDDLASLHCAGLIHLFFEKLLQCLPSRRVSEQERKSSAKRAQRIRTITGYIEQHYTEKLLLTDLARELDLSMSYLSSFFKSVFGMSFQSYVMKMRCEKARQLLLLTDFSLLDISIACGFSDLKYLNQGFFKQFGCSPRQYHQKFEKEEVAQQQSSILITQEFLSPDASCAVLERYLPHPKKQRPDRPGPISL